MMPKPQPELPEPEPPAAAAGMHGSFRSRVVMYVLIAMFEMTNCEQNHSEKHAVYTPTARLRLCRRALQLQTQLSTFKGCLCSHTQTSHAWQFRTWYRSLYESTASQSNNAHYCSTRLRLGTWSVKSRVAG